MAASRVVVGVYVMGRDRCCLSLLVHLPLNGIIYKVMDEIFMNQPPVWL